MGVNEVWFGIDPASARNSAALAGVGRDAEGRFAPVALREWIPRPGSPLDLRLREGPEAARIVRACGGDAWATDAYALTEMRHVGNEHGIQTIVETSDVTEQWRHVTAAMSRGKVALALPPVRRLYTTSDGEERAYVEQEDLDALVAQLRTIQKVYGAGKVSIKIPEIDGLHGDLARAFARALWLAKAGDVLDETPRRVDIERLGGRSRTDTRRTGLTSGRRW